MIQGSRGRGFFFSSTACDVARLIGSPFSSPSRSAVRVASAGRRSGLVRPPLERNGPQASIPVTARPLLLLVTEPPQHRAPLGLLLLTLDSLGRTAIYHTHHATRATGAV